MFLQASMQDDFGGTLDLIRWKFRGSKNSGNVAEVFLLVEPSIGCWEVHQILHCMRHCQIDHQEAMTIYSST